MSVSIRLAVNNILKSGLYDKKNLWLFIGTCLLLALGQTLSQNYIIITLVLMLIYNTIINGTCFTTLNNVIYKRESIFPSLTKDLNNILLTGIKYYLAQIVYALFIILLFMLYTMVISLSNDIQVKIMLMFLSIIVMIVILILFLLATIGMNFHFSSTLKFPELLNVVKGFKFLKNIKKSLLSYISKVFLTAIIITAIMIAVSGIFIILFTIQANVTGMNNAQALHICKQIGYFMGLIEIIFTILIYIDLTGQLYSKLIVNNEQPTDTDIVSE